MAAFGRTRWRDWEIRSACIATCISASIVCRAAFTKPCARAFFFQEPRSKADLRQLSARMIHMRKHFLVLLAIVAAAGIGDRLGKTTTASAASTGRVFEIRTYTAEPGKLEALHARFRDHTLAIFKRLNMTSVAYFAPTDVPLSKNT